MRNVRKGVVLCHSKRVPNVRLSPLGLVDLQGDIQATAAEKVIETALNDKGKRGMGELRCAGTCGSPQAAIVERLIQFRPGVG